jgi:hypothetical protein
MKLQFCGFYIYPGLPNATPIQQEMHINYGLFTLIVCNNLKRIASAFYAAGEDIPIGVSTFCLVIYGGTIPVGTTSIMCRNALAETFNVPSNNDSLRKVSAVPHTRKYLTNPKVHHNGADEHNPNFDIFQDIQSQNNYSTAQLNVMGYRGNMLRAQFSADKVSKRKAMAPATVAHICEHQEALPAACTHGKKFFVMGGEHVTLDDMFKAAEINRGIEESTEREKVKKSQVEYHARRKATLPILNPLKNDLESNIAQLTSKELETSLNGKALQCQKWGQKQTDAYCTNNFLREPRRM